MDGSIPDLGLKHRLVEREADLERQIAAERARTTPDETLIRRLTRERLLARDRIAALSGSALPRWARTDRCAGEGPSCRVAGRLGPDAALSPRTPRSLHRRSGRS